MAKQAHPKTKYNPAEPTETVKPDGAPKSATPSGKPPGGKLRKVVELLSRAEGAQLEDMMAATGWQAHSVRGAMSGALKRHRGLTISSEKGEEGRVYRIIGAQA